MFRKLLNVGKAHSSIDKLQQNQHQNTTTNQNQQNQSLQQLLRSQFEYNEIKSYGFSQLSCLAYSDYPLSLLVVGSKHGLVRVFGAPSVEFQYQLECLNSIRQLEFINCRAVPQKSTSNNTNGKSKNGKNNNKQVDQKTDKISSPDMMLPAKLVALTDNGQLHLLELKTIKQQNFADNQTQTETLDCCANPKTSQQQHANNNNSSTQNQGQSIEFSSLEFVGTVDYFKCNLEDDDRSRRVSTIEISSDGTIIYVGTEGGNVYLIPIAKFNESKDDINQVQQLDIPTKQDTITTSSSSEKVIHEINDEGATQKKIDVKEDDADKISLSVEQQVTNIDAEQEKNQEPIEKEPFNIIKFEDNVSQHLSDDIKHKKPGAIESIKRHPTSSNKLLLSYHRGLSVIYDLESNKLDKYFYHNQVLEYSCFADQTSGDFFYTSHNDGSYIKWDTRLGNQSKANEDSITLLYGPYPCKPTPKIIACSGLINDQLEDLVIFSGGLEKRNDDDKNRVTIVRADGEGKREAVKIVFDFTSKVLDFLVINRPRGNLTPGNATNNNKSHQQSNTGGGGGKKNKNKQNQQHNRNAPIAVALAILTEEEFVVIDLLNPKGSTNFLEFPLPYLNCIHSSAITCSQLYSNIGDKLYEKLQTFCKTQVRGKLSANEWPISGGKVIEQIESKSHDVLLTGHEDGSINIWDVSNLSMRHLQHISTSRFFSTNDDDLNTSNTSSQQDSSASAPLNHQNHSTYTNNNDSANNNESNNNNFNINNDTLEAGTWPPLKKVGRFDPYSDDARLAIRRLTMCRQTGALVAAGTGGQVVVLELNEDAHELTLVEPKEVTLVTDRRFVWKGHDRLPAKLGKHSEAPGYQLSNCVQIVPPVAATSLELRADWRLFALGTSYGFLLYDLSSNEPLVAKSTLNLADFAIISGDAPGTMSRKKSFRKSLRESFRRLRLGRSMRSPQHSSQSGALSASHRETGAPASVLSRAGGRQAAPAFSRPTTGVRTLGPPITGSTPIPTSSGSSPIPSDHHSIQQLNHHAGRNAIFSGERQVEAKVELSSIVRCLSFTWAHIGPTNSPSRPSLWVGTNSGQVLIYGITLPVSDQTTESNRAQESPETNVSVETSPTSTNNTAGTSTASTPTIQRAEAKLAREIQLKHRAPIVAIFVTPNDDSDLESILDHSNSVNQLEKSTSFESSTTGGVSVGATSQESTSLARSPDQERELASQSPTPGTRRPGNANDQQQARVLICTEEQFKVFNLPNLKPFCKFKLTANEGLRAKKAIISHFKKPLPKTSDGNSLMKASKSLTSFATQTSRPTTPAEEKQQTSENNNSPNQLNNNHAISQQQTKELMAAKFGAKNSNTLSNSQTQAPLLASHETIQTSSSTISVYEPYLVCMSNQGDCAIYSTNDLKRQAQVQVCKREDVNGIQSTMLTQFGEGYYLKSTSNFLRFSLTNQRIPRVLAQI